METGKLLIYNLPIKCATNVNDPLSLAFSPQVNSLGQVLLYRSINVERTSMWIQKGGGSQGAGKVTFLTDVPVVVKAKTKKEYFGTAKAN